MSGDYMRGVSIFVLFIYICEGSRILVQPFLWSLNMLKHNSIHSSMTVSQNIIEVDFMAEQLHWIALDCTGASYKVATRCKLNCTFSYLLVVIVAFGVNQLLKLQVKLSELHHLFRWLLTQLKRCCWWQWLVSIKSCQGLLKNTFILTQTALLSRPPRPETHSRDLTPRFLLHPSLFLFQRLIFHWKTWFSSSSFIYIFFYISSFGL